MFVYVFYRRSGSKVFDRSSSKILQTADSTALSVVQDPSQMSSTEDVEDSIFEPKTVLSATASLTEIFDAMRQPTTGITFISKMQGLPSYTFVSCDAINWLNNHIDGQCNAIEILERMRR